MVGWVKKKQKVSQKTLAIDPNEYEQTFEDGTKIVDISVLDTFYDKIIFGK